MEKLSGGRFPLVALGSLVSQEPDYGSGARAIERLADDLPRYIRITDFGEDGIEEGHNYVAPYPIEEECLLDRNDLLFARSGATVGKTYIHENVSVPSIFAGYCIRFKIDPQKALPRFVYYFTKTKLYGKWVAAIQRPSGQPNINKEEFKSLILPLPSPPEQHEMVARLDKAREERKKKLAEAERLVEDIDGIVLSTVAVGEIGQVRRHFAIHPTNLRDMLTPERYLAMQIETQMGFNDKIESVTTLCDARFIPSTEAPDEEFDWIRIDDLPNNPWEVGSMRTGMGKDIGGTFFLVEEGDILIARLGPTILNAKFVLCPRTKRRVIASAEFLVLKCKEGTNPRAVLWILRTELYRRVMYLRSRGATPSRLRLNGPDLLDIPFPFLDSKLQLAITSKIDNAEAEVRSKRSEADRIWQKAKDEFEGELLH